MSQQEGITPNRPQCIPVAPAIRRVLEAHIAKLESDPAIKAAVMGGVGSKNQRDLMTAVELVAVRIWPESTKDSAIRRLYDIRGGKWELMEFDLADRILCRLDLVHLWREDPELAAIYQATNLRAIDATRPTSEATREAFNAWALEQLGDKPTESRAKELARKYSIPFGPIKRAVREAKALAVA